MNSSARNNEQQSVNQCHLPLGNLWKTKSSCLEVVWVYRWEIKLKMLFTSLPSWISFVWSLDTPSYGLPPCRGGGACAFQWSWELSRRRHVSLWQVQPSRKDQRGETRPKGSQNSYSVHQQKSGTFYSRSEFGQWFCQVLLCMHLI